MHMFQRAPETWQEAGGRFLRLRRTRHIQTPNVRRKTARSLDGDCAITERTCEKKLHTHRRRPHDIFFHKRDEGDKTMR